MRLCSHRARFTHVYRAMCATHTPLDRLQLFSAGFQDARTCLSVRRVRASATACRPCAAGLPVIGRRSLSPISAAGTCARRNTKDLKSRSPRLRQIDARLPDGNSSAAERSHHCTTSCGFWLRAGDAFVGYAPVPWATQMHASNPKATSELRGHKTNVKRRRTTKPKSGKPEAALRLADRSVITGVP